MTCELKLEGIPMAGFQSSRALGMINNVQVYQFNGGFRDEWSTHAIGDNMHFNLTENFVEFSIPFEDDEEICWECLGYRFIGLIIDLNERNGIYDNPDKYKTVEHREFCQEPECTKSGEKIHKREYTWKEIERNNI
jgi:hypothetical protein